MIALIGLIGWMQLLKRCGGDLLGEFTDEQLEIINKYPVKLILDNWRVLGDTEDELVLLHKRGRRLTIKKGDYN